MAPSRVNVCWLRRFVSVVVGFGMVLVVANGATGQSAYEVLHGFARDEFGRSPVANLIQARDGDFYGMTADGGIAGGDSVAGGTIFKITAAGILTTLHSFDCSTEGCGSSSFFVQSGLFQARDGDFYGTTPLGGTAVGNSGLGGTVFKITAVGTLTVLHAFDCGTGSCLPNGGLIQARDEDDFYGTTGGFGDDAGTVFKIAADGTLTTLHSFDCDN